MARRRTSLPPSPRLSAADYLRELRAGLHAPVTSVELGDEALDPIGALLGGREDVGRTIEIGDADARNGKRMS